MKRRRSSAPGRVRPDGRRSYPILLGALLIALAACGQATSTDQPPTSDQPSTTAQATDRPSDASDAGVEPTAPQPSTSSSGRPTADPGSVAACSGSDQNRDFFASMAAAVDWPVYCPTRLDGWFVVDGQYRLAGGGWMEISYHGPGDALIVLREGAFCGDGGCVPAGREVGETAFGDRIGMLVAGDDGSWSIVLGRNASPTWLLVGTGLDEAGARTIAADLLPIPR